jgi:predicted nucleic acid-binding protein
VIFVDTAFWVALRNNQDVHHSEASTLLRTHGGEPLVTSNHVRGETWTVLLRRAGHGAAVRFLDQLRASSRVDVIHVPVGVEDEALRWLRRHEEREYSFVDATSFALMREMRIRRALTFDDDFTEAGFRLLRSR